jgi:hypothetical protein
MEAHFLNISTINIYAIHQLSPSENRKPKTCDNYNSSEEEHLETPLQAMNWLKDYRKKIESNSTLLL